MTLDRCRTNFEADLNDCIVDALNGINDALPAFVMMDDGRSDFIFRYGQMHVQENGRDYLVKYELRHAAEHILTYQLEWT